MTDYELAKRSENWMVPPEWTYRVFAFLVFVVWPAIDVAAVQRC